MTPQKLSNLEVSFPGPSVTAKLMPKYETIPEEFKSGSSKWRKFQADWFCSGLKNLIITPKPGIDQRDAIGHLSAIQGSFEPPHEHKCAAVAFLAALWFEDVTYEKAR